MRGFCTLKQRRKMLRLQRVEGNCYDPSLQPEKILLKPTVTRLGRSDEYSDVVIDSVISPLMISRVHAEIHFSNGKFRIDCKGLNGLLVNKTKRSSAVLCDGDVVVFGGAGVKTKEGQSLSAYDSELVYVFNEVCQNDSEEVGSLGEGTSDGSVRRRSKRKKPASLSEGVSSPCEKKTKGSMDDKQVFEVDQKADPQEEVNITEVDDSRSKKCLKDLNEELLCCICCELMVLAHTLPCSVHTFCFGCIRDWLCHSKDCPNCRAKAQLKSAVPVKVLDNTINKVAEEVLSLEELEERQLKI
nr:E3 ubiquitin-protein ligase CHFR-like isoform X1 [Pocillopora verrucosa]XP_058968513.1 E3 ubiquitin-protein ligase CHFR-like isoform X1 [Pocillopora verrucosa]